jgi:hypothetical protein
MPVSVSVSSIEWVRHVVFTGVVTDHDLAAAYDVAARCLLDPSMDLLVDTTGVECLATTSEGLRTLASRGTRDALQAGVALPRVVVVAPNSRVFGVACMYEAPRESASGAATYVVCRTIAEARRWLGLSNDPSAVPLLLERA